MTSNSIKENSGNNKPSVIGITDGSGVYDIESLTNKPWLRGDSPFGEPSDECLFGELGGHQMIFLPRHGLDAVADRVIHSR